jgi:hypothetical protein
MFAPRRNGPGRTRVISQTAIALEPRAQWRANEVARL